MSHESTNYLRSDALAIWHAAVEAVRSDRLVRDSVHVRGDSLEIAGESIELQPGSKIIVVGAGKAGAGMAAGLEAALGPELAERHQLTGWLNVPADCVRGLAHIHLHPARPAGVNEPTAEGVTGSQQILDLVSAAREDDLVIALISGGGSALLPLPVEGISLADKLAVTRILSAAGAPIDDLNTVRKQLSRIKGGGLARACRGRLVTLIISDVLGNPLDIIASGPTVEDSSRPEDAVRILEKYRAREGGISQRVFAALAARTTEQQERPSCRVSNHIIGSNAVAVAAAARKARELGYRATSDSAAASEGAAEPIGVELAERALAMRERGKFCFISGGEPTVKLVEAGQRGRGGRNQQLVLAAIGRLWSEDVADIAILSGGTDGEDGPTDAAGALADEELISAAKRRKLDPQNYLARNDAYRFFEPLGGLIKTGPTHTNVCDVRVVLVDQATS